MVVDDTPANLRLLDELLRQQGYQVRLFPRGVLALKAAAANPPDLILLDIMMPDMDGFEVCRQLKASPGLHDIPVIFISALADTDNKVNAFAQGGMDYVTKPFEEGEVLARVRTHLALYAMQQAQTRQQARLAQLVDERTADLLRAQHVAHIGSWKFNLQTRDLTWSAETYRIFGITQGTPLTLKSFLDKVPPQDRDSIVQAWALALQGQPYDIEHRINPPAGAQWVRERAELTFGPDGLAREALGTVQDITGRKLADLALETERLRLHAAIEATQAGIWECTLQTGQMSLSVRAAAILGYEPEELANTPFDTLLSWVHPEDTARTQDQLTRHLAGNPADKEHPNGVEVRMRHKSGHWVWCRHYGRVMARSDSGQPLTMVGISIDITDQKEHQQHIEFITHHDVLTGLPNRTRFLDLLRVCMASSSTLQTRLAVAYIDLDGFAALNAQFGRDTGNQLIVELGKRLARAVRERQYLARIGGDEFAVILSGLQDGGSYLVPVQRLLEAVSQPLDINGQSTQITASIGVSLFPQSDTVEAEQLLRQADQAMYLAKLAGKNRHHVFDPMKDESTRERFLRLEEVRRSLAQGEMRLFYQPKIWLASGEVVGFEALIRWQHPQRGLVPPAQFIPLLEQHPLAIQVGDWVIETALLQLARWNADGLHTSVSVNIESLQLQDPDFVPRLARQLAACPDVQASQLELEILETGALDNMAHVSRLIAELQTMGVACSLDDFGTGYSSLTFLKQLAAQTIKIDQSFVRGMLDDSENASIVNSVLGLAHSFDRHTLAEGVETEAHGQALVELGCEMAQGYAIARPMPAEAVPAWLAQWHPPLSWQNTRALQPGDIQLLLAEIEHRTWMKDLKAHLEGNQDSPPSLNKNACHFGVWLDKTATRRRFGHLPEFQGLQELHQNLHTEGEALAQSVSPLRQPLPPEPQAGKTPLPADWSRLQIRSAELTAMLRHMRQNHEPSSGFHPGTHW
jgi:diguanylate cyclase (GGDEF)-like protein/PAS domain S-box-containing protein